MIPNTFALTLAFAQTHGYFLIFLIMVAEGPAITTAAAFAASLGVLNVYVVLFLSLLGDLTGDALFYGIGRLVSRPVIDRYGKYVGINEKHITGLQEKLHKHFLKTFVFIKYSPIICQPGLVMMGAMKIPLKRFFGWSFVITFPRNIFFTLLGYLGGVIIFRVLRYFNLVQYIIPLAILAGIGVYFWIRGIQRRYLERVK